LEEEVKVEWKGYPSNEATWEPVENFIDKFGQRIKELRSKSQVKSKFESCSSSSIVSEKSVKRCKKSK